LHFLRRGDLFIDIGANYSRIRRLYSNSHGF
jgi:hypothetical protein